MKQNVNFTNKAKQNVRFGLIFLLSLFAVVCSAQTNSVNSKFANYTNLVNDFVSFTSSPNGFDDYCDRTPAIGCEQVTVKNKSWNFKTLVAVNETINKTVKFQADIKTYNKFEYWNVAKDVGDCEDYALAKMKMLLDSGVPVEKLLLATAWTENNEYHLVLLVDLDDKYYVLDSRTNAVRAHDTIVGYRFNKRQYKGGGRDWVMFE